MEKETVRIKLGRGSTLRIVLSKKRLLSQVIAQEQQAQSSRAGMLAGRRKRPEELVWLPQVGGYIRFWDLGYRQDGIDVEWYYHPAWDYGSGSQFNPVLYSPNASSVAARDAVVLAVDEEERAEYFKYLDVVYGTDTNMSYWYDGSMKSLNGTNDKFTDEGLKLTSEDISDNRVMVGLGNAYNHFLWPSWFFNAGAGFANAKVTTGPTYADAKVPFQPSLKMDIFLMPMVAASTANVVYHAPAAPTSISDFLNYHHHHVPRRPLFNDLDPHYGAMQNGQSQSWTNSGGGGPLLNYQRAMALGRLVQDILGARRSIRDGDAFDYTWDETQPASGWASDWSDTTLPPIPGDHQSVLTTLQSFTSSTWLPNGTLLAIIKKDNVLYYVWKAPVGTGNDGSEI